MATTLQAETREKVGKYVSFELRKVGKIPAVVYGQGLKTNINLTIDQKALKQVLAGGSRLLDLNIGGKVQMAVVKDVQHAVIGSEIIHADFRAVDENTTLHLNVEVLLKGDAIGLTLGGILEQNLHMVTLECLPKNLPAKVELDVSAMSIGNVLFVNDLPKLDGVKYITHGDVPVVSCRIKSEEAAAAATTTEAAADGAAATDAKAADAKAPAGDAKAAAKPAADKKK